LTFVASYGLTRDLDISLVVPVSNVRLGVSSLATIFNFEPPPVNHRFATVSGNPGNNNINPYNGLFTSAGSATGIGDVTVRGKYKTWQSADERSALALGLDVRFPTGDAYNFLGAGTWGVRPFVTFSRSGRVSPHATLGFQGNGSSVLAGSVTSQPVSNAKLPDIFSYSVGADVSLGRLASVSSDFIGQSLLSASKVNQTTYTDYAGGTHPEISTTTATVNELSMSVGGKIKLNRRLLFSANVLFRLNDAGLHSKPVPLAGLSYSF
jgi:hypothetical protein